jgi:hypothetical protein
MLFQHDTDGWTIIRTHVNDEYISDNPYCAAAWTLHPPKGKKRREERVGVKREKRQLNHLFFSLYHFFLLTKAPFETFFSPLLSLHTLIFSTFFSFPYFLFLPSPLRQGWYEKVACGGWVSSFFDLANRTQFLQQ